MYQQEDLQPFNRNYIYIGLIALVIFTFILFGTIRQFQPSPVENTTTSPRNIVENGNNTNESLFKYNEDSDGDKIPNFMEKFLSLSEYSSEVNECEKRNTICSKDPRESVQNIIFLLDASTSMNIVGTENSKLEEVKNSVNQLINSELNKSYFKTSIFSYGNKGTQGFIADNESCVSVVRHKKLDTPIEAYQNLSAYIPNGKSPLAYSLEQISTTLNKNENNLIIIITDGIDDCNGNVQATINSMIKNGNLTRADIMTIFANEDANTYLKNAAELNSGIFNQNPDIVKEVNFNSINFMKQNWCKTADTKKFTNCISEKYRIATSYLNDQKNNKNLSEVEINKVNEVQGAMTIFEQSIIKRYQNTLNTEFNNYLEKEE